MFCIKDVWQELVQFFTFPRYNLPMQIYFIRHGQSQNNALYAATRSSNGRSHDPELTSLGHQQAQQVAAYLCNPELFQPGYLYTRKNEASAAGISASPGSLTHLYSSLMVRAAATASYISAALSLPHHAFVDLHEAGGIYLDQPRPDPALPGSIRVIPVGLPGNNRAYFKEHFPGLILPPGLGPGGWWDRPFELMEQRSMRADRVLQTLIDRHGSLNPDGSEDRVALVSHGGFYNHFMRSLLGLPPRRPEEELADVWFELNNTAITRIDYLQGHFTIQYMNDARFLPPDWLT